MFNMFLLPYIGRDSVPAILCHYVESICMYNFIITPGMFCPVLLPRCISSPYSSLMFCIRNNASGYVSNPGSLKERDAASGKTLCGTSPD